MPENAFALSPLESAMEAARSRRAARSLQTTSAPAPAVDSSQVAAPGAANAAIPADFSPFEAASVRSNVPVNILQGVAEAAGIGPDRADDLAQRLSGPLAQGRTVPEAVAAIFPDGKVPDGFIDAVRERAKAIGAQYGQAQAPAAPEAEDRGVVETILDPFGTTKEMLKGGARGVAGAVSAGATTLGYPETAAAAGQIAADPRLAPGVGSYSDVDGPGSAARYVAGLASESAPEMAAVIGAGVVGSAGGPAGTIAAGVAASTFFNTGRNLQRQAAENPDEDTSYARAVTAGLVQGGLDVVVPGHILGAFGTRLLGALAERGLVRVSKEIGSDAVVEGITEGTQQLIEMGQANPDLLRILVNPGEGESEKSDQLVNEIVESMVGGAAVGGAFSAGAAALGSPAQESAAAPGVAAAATAEPAPPAGPMETALAQGPAPLAPDIEIGAAIEITNTDPETGEVISVPATFVSEDPLGVRIRDAEGTEHIVPREEIEAGVSVLAPRGAAGAQDMGNMQNPHIANPADNIPDLFQGADSTTATGEITEPVQSVAPAAPPQGDLAATAQAGIASPDVPAREDRPSEPETPEEIETRLEYLRSQRRTGTNLKRINREISDLTDRLSALQPEVDAAAAPDYAPEPAGSAGDAVAASEPAVSETPEPATTPSEIRTQAGAPFRSIGQAKQAVRARGLDPENFTIRPTDGGFVVVPQETPTDLKSAAQTEDPAPPVAEPSDQGGGAAPPPPDQSPEAAPVSAQQTEAGPGEAVEGVGAPSAATPPVTGFTTAKGSTYVVNGSSTTRNKAARSDVGHEGDSGAKPPSARTLYLKPEDAQRLAPPQGRWSMVDHKDGTVSLVTLNDDGKWGVSPSARKVPASDAPAVGSIPLELWSPEVVNGAQGFRKIHLGNEITAVSTETPVAQVEEKPASPRAEIKAAPLYVERKVTNPEAIVAWAKAQGFATTLRPEDMHITVAFSRDPVDPAAAPALSDARESGPMAKAEVKKLGEAVVLAFPPSFLALDRDHKRYRDAGASWDHPSYIPHITITYQPGDVDLSAVKPFRGTIALGPEAHAPLDTDAASKVEEVPTGAAKNTKEANEQAAPSAETPQKAAGQKTPAATNGRAAALAGHSADVPPDGWGTGNKLVSADRAAVLREKLKAKLRDQLNSGIDPEILAIGAELAVFHIEAGARRFADLAAAIADDLGTTLLKLKPYLRSWYNGARDLMEDGGQSIEGMDDPAAVREALTKITEPVVQSEAEDGADGDDDRGNAADHPEPLAEDVPRDGEAGIADDLAVGEPGERETDPDGDGRPDAGHGVVGTGGVGGSPDAVLPDGAGAKDRPVGQGPIRRTEDKPAPLSGESPGNFVITPDVGVGTGTNGQKIAANLAAIRTLKTVRADNRFPTPDEQAAMARYVGWGGLKPVFDVKKEGSTDMYGRAQVELREILTPQEYRAASASITDAHYTAPGVVDAMWRAARHFGFKGGRVLEPTVGVGNFLGLQPADMAASSEWHAAELDHVTGGLAQMLYPEANILPGTAFEDAPFADGVFDLAIGNPPFGDFRVKDKHKGRKKISGLKIHNYIIAKAGMHLRPGGIMSMVVTHRFLDTANPEARDVLASDFRFIGAIRLPNDAFRANAGTDVTTDIVFFQKLGPSEKRDRAASWLDVEGELPGGVRVNRYFQENPGHILGRSAMDGSMYGGRRDAEGNGEYTVHSDGRDIGAAIDEILSKDWKAERNTLTDGPAAPPTAVMLTQTDLPVGGMMLDADQQVIRRGMDDDRGNSILETVTAESFWKDLAAEWDSVAKAVSAVKEASGDGRRHATMQHFFDLREAALPVAFTTKGERKASPTQAEQAIYDVLDALEMRDGRDYEWRHDAALALIERAATNKRLGSKGYAALRGMLDLRNRTIELIAAEQSDADNIEDLRASLNEAYDGYVKSHGLIGGNIGLLDGDIGVEVGLEASYDPAISAEAAKKEGVQPRPAQATRSAILSKRINYPYKPITRADSAEDGLGISLSERGKVDLPYIAGLVGKSVKDVTEELSRGAEPRIFFDPKAEAYVDAEEYLSGNVKKKLFDATEAGLKQNVAALEKAQPEPMAKSRITPSIRGAWVPREIMQEFLTDVGVASPNVVIIPEIGRIIAKGQGSAPSALGAEFKDDNASLIDIFNAAAQGKPITVSVDKEATRVLGAKVERMSKVFAEWAYSEDARAKRIVDAFNENMNTHRPRKYDGVKYLKLPGASTQIKLRRTQKNAAWRMVLSRNVLLDHVVGAGKAQGLDSLLLTPTGWTRMGDIRPGDTVIAGDGTPTDVEAIFPQGEREMFRVTMSDGSSTECCAEHLWLTQTYMERGYAQRAAREGKSWECAQPKVRSLAEIRETLVAPHLSAKNHSIPMVGPVQFDPKPVPLDPWLMGFLIGDGCFVGKSITFSTVDAEILDRIRAAIPAGCAVEHSSRCDYRINGGRPHVIRDALRLFGLLGKRSAEKHVPPAYLFNEVGVRIEVLRGLMDSDGTVNARGTHVSFTTASPELAECVEFLARSLGGVSRRSLKVATGGLPAHNVTLTMPAAINPFWLTRKAERVRAKSSYAPARYITAVESVGQKQAQCIRVAHPSHLYVTDDFIVTHNTYTIIAGVMEKRRLGISRKPLIAVPNHLVVQWARDFYNLYPSARILAATPADFTLKNRRRLLARIATGDFDAIIIGHTSLGFIETPPEDLRLIIDEKVEELESALKTMRANDESKRTQGQIEKKLKTYTERLEEMAERTTGQIGVNLREMGVDDLTVDELHEFKNLEYSTAGERVVGMNDPNGSKKAFDLYAKVRGIQARKGSFTGATGTPVSNSLVELFTVMSYFAHDDLAARNQGHFDAWSGAYAVTETKLEYTATQKLKPRRVLASLTNLAAMHQVYANFADTITMSTIKAMHAEDVAARNKETGAKDRTEFPVPKVKDGGRVLVKGEITPRQSEYMDYLVARMNAVQAAGRKPEYMRIDNALWVLTDARKMSLDIRNVDPTAERDENGKVIRAARSIKESYDKWAADRGTQLVFCDLSTPSKGAAKAAGKILGDAAKAIWGDKDGRARLKAMDGRSFEDRWRWLNAQFDAAMENPDTTEDRRDALAAHFDAIEDADAAMAVADVGFSVYDDMREVLSGMGIPATEIAFIHDYETPAQKQKLFAKVNSGQIRVLMGSSQKMGAGTNAQERLVALHHMDAPWRPSDVEQREGRIIRQGNKLYERDPDGFEVEINAYSTEGTSDTVMWQVLQRKAAGIEQFREGGIDAMDEDGGDSDQYAEFMAASTGNPVFRYNLEAERAATDAQSQYGGRQIAKANALRFIEKYDSRKRELTARIAAASEASPGDLSFGGETGSIEELNTAIAAANRAFEKSFAKFEEDMAAWKPLAEESIAKADAEEAAGIEKKKRTKIPTAPEKPVRPNMMSPEVLAKSGYARAVKAALEKIAASEFDESIAIKVGGADLLLEKRKRHNGEPSYELHVDLDGETFSVGWSDARVPVNSPNMLAAFAPGNIFGKVERVAANARAEIADMDARLPKERETAKIEVSRKDADDARDLSNWYKAQVALAEVSADLKRADRPNSYIAADTKRPLKQFGSEGKEAPRTFEYGGEAYEGTGITASGGFHGVRLYEATRRGDGKKAVVLFETKQDGEVRDVMVEPAAAAAAEMPTVSDRSGVRFKNAAALLRHLRSLPYGPLVDKLIAAGWLRIEDEPPAGKNYGGVTLAVPGDPELGLPRIVHQITLYATRLTPATASGVVLHEMFHGGVARLLGAEAFAKLLGRVDRIRRAQIAKLGGDLPDPNTHEGARYTSAEEFAAYSLEHRERGVGSGLAEAMDRILGAFKAFVLRRFGMQVGEVSDAQLRALAIAALRNEARRRGGDTPGSGVNAGPRSLSVGLRLPGDGTIKNRQGHEILQHRDVFKSMPSYADGIEDEADGSSVTSSDWPVAERGLIGNAITKAMGGDYGLLGLVPGRPLFNELAKGMPAAQEYLRLKGEMDALRSEWFAKTDTVAQKWRKSLSQNGEANKALMDLMHESTLAGADPSKPFVYNIKGKDEATRKRAHAALKARYDALPDDFKAVFGEVRDAYKALGDEFEATLLANVNKAMDVGLARAQRAHDEAMEQARDDGLAGAALASVKAAADKKLATAKLWSGWNKKARMADLRMKFETSKVAEPYFPLARFGDFFVTVRDKEDGHVVAFSRFEEPGPTPWIAAKRKMGLGDTQTQQEFAAEMRSQGYDVEEGTIGKASVKNMVDAEFVTDIENILQNAGVPDAVMESVWQRWLETLPDFSIRKARIHRKGTAGFSTDAFRAFGHHMFHGSHQLARLRYSMDLQEALELTKAATRHQPDPVRAGLIWQEMERRHEFAMNPKGAWWSQAISSAAFFFHLAFSPAAALVNLTQTTVIGIPVLAGFHGETARGVAIASRQIGRALSDFTSGKGHALESDRLSPDEKDALREAYRRGTIDASQAHDLAGVAENGIEYSDLRSKWMGRAAFFFHHAERLNREVTFLAAYRMAKAKGMEDHAAIDRAGDLTWRIHFDYQNTAKPRFMQGDMGRAFLTFRNYQTNMIWRLVRDFHQGLHGATPEERREALHQLGGITASMALHAGIKGTWLYGLTMMLVGLLFEGGSDDAEEELQRGAVALLGRQGAALVLNGIPGTITGTALSERIGMPDLWFRSPDRPLEGKDLYLYWVEQMLGAGVGIVANQFVGADMIASGNTQRGIETMMPKFIRDGMRAVRYATDGVETMKGDTIVEGTDPSRALKQLMGFTPAEVAERYEANSRMKNREQRIEEDRSKIIADYVAALRDGGAPSPEIIARKDRYNEANPDYPIMPDNIRRSLQGKIRAAQRNEFGASINPRLNDRIRSEAAPLLSGE